MGILQARILEWVAMPFSRGSSWPRDQTRVSYVSCLGRWVPYLQHHLGSPLDSTVISKCELLTVVFLFPLQWTERVVQASYNSSMCFRSCPVKPILVSGSFEALRKILQAQCHSRSIWEKQKFGHPENLECDPKGEFTRDRLAPLPSQSDHTRASTEVLLKLNIFRS